MIYEPGIWKYIPELPRWTVPIDLRTPLRQRLQSDGMCDECKLWCDVPVKGWYRCLKQSYNLFCVSQHQDLYFGKLNMGRCCSYIPRPPHNHFYCSDCGTYHHMDAYRQCLCRQGSVQLCEHVHISWATVEAHIAGWQERKPGDWDGCFDNFNIECHDPSHDTRCTAEEPPTWPRARLQSSQSRYGKGDGVVLSLEWKPHSGLGAFTCTTEGAVPAPELRALFQRYRNGAASILLLSYPSCPLPEMVCFDPTKCSCLYYEMGGNKRPGGWNPSKCAGFPRGDRPFKCPAPHLSCRPDSAGGNGELVRMDNHRPRGMRNSTCLITTYQRKIFVCLKTDRTKLNPTHAWFHAMDPDTFHRPDFHYDLPLCKNNGCMNYYRRPKTFYCSGWKERDLRLWHSEVASPHNIFP